jgi:hypothetical protein
VARAAASEAVAAAAINIDRKALTESTLRIKDIHIVGEGNTMAHPKRDEEDSIGGRGPNAVWKAIELRDGAETFKVAPQVFSREAPWDARDPDSDKRLSSGPAKDGVSINSSPGDASKQAVKNRSTECRSSKSKVEK